jgi:hypothetical protein
VWVERDHLETLAHHRAFSAQQRVGREELL